MQLTTYPAAQLITDKDRAPDHTSNCAPDHTSDQQLFTKQQKRIQSKYMMTIDEALKYVNSKSCRRWKLGLSRTIELLDRVGNPHKRLKFVHVAGTNGKGSTCEMIASILAASGYRTGMYPSPYIEKFNERIQINGEQISDDDLCELTEIVKMAGDAMEDHPTHFEIITAIGMLYFERRKCDIVVLEVGLGGTFDSTNIIDAPELCVITNIGFDHTDYLGNTLAEIASAKAGIIKDGADVVCYPNVPEVMNVIETACREHGSRLIAADFSRIEVIEAGLTGQKLRWKKESGERPGASEAPETDLRPEQSFQSEPVSCIGTGEEPETWVQPEAGIQLEFNAQPEPDVRIGHCKEPVTDLRPAERSEQNSAKQHEEVIKSENNYNNTNIVIQLSLIGEYQLRNAAVVLTAAEELAKRGWKITEDSIREGMSKAKWPARFELLGTNPVFILDGGHNLQCAEAVAESIRKYLPEYRQSGLTLIIGMLRDKDYEAAIRVLLPFASKVYCLRPDSDRALPAAELAETVKQLVIERSKFQREAEKLAEEISKDMQENAKKSANFHILQDNKPTSLSDTLQDDKSAAHSHTVQDNKPAPRSHNLTGEDIDEEIEKVNERHAGSSLTDKKYSPHNADLPQVLLNPEIIVCDSVTDAVKDSMSGDVPVLTFGSLYLAGEIRRTYRQQKDSRAD